MDHHDLSRLRGAVDLAADAVDATVGRVAALHEQIGRWAYAPLKLIGPLAGPAAAIEQIQTTITRGVYGSIRGVSRGVALGARQALDGLAAGDEPRGTQRLIDR